MSDPERCVGGTPGTPCHRPAEVRIYPTRKAPEPLQRYYGKDGAPVCSPHAGDHIEDGTGNWSEHKEES